MAKEKSIYSCTECGATSAKWLGKCPGCGAWNTLVESVAESAGKPRYAAGRGLLPAEAVAILERNAPTRAEREANLRAKGFPAYTTSTGWLGYSDDKVRRLCRQALAQSWTHFKIKVGVNIEDDCRRAALMREEIGPDRKLMVDANQVWQVNEAIENMHRLGPHNP